MEGLKRWQLIVLILALLALPASIFYTCSQMPHIDPSKTRVFVDVTSGELFEATVPTKRSIIFPVKHPQTQKETLYPAVRKEGKWFVEGRFLPYIGGPDKNAPLDLKGISDVKTGEIKVVSDTPAKANLFD